MDTITYLRQFRIGGLAIFDLVVSYIGIYFLAPLLTKLLSKFHISISRTQWLWLTVPLGTVVHVLVGQKTALTKMLFNPNGDYVMKLIFLFMIYMGLKNTKRNKHKLKGR